MRDVMPRAKRDPATLKILDAQREAAVKKVQAAGVRKEQGTSGLFQSETDDAHGEALLLNNTLYLGTDFWATPGENVHLYTWSGIDPRDKVFPDANAADLGTLQNFYGAQSIGLVQSSGTGAIHSLVLYDPKIKWLLGFAQLQ